jgi:hypothetical protein
VPNKFMAAAGRGVMSKAGWTYDPPWFWSITRRSIARAFANRSAAQTAVVRGANRRLAVCCTGVIDGGRGGVTNDIAV